jgi:hypothetical protein
MGIGREENVRPVARRGVDDASQPATPEQDLLSCGAVAPVACPEIPRIRPKLPRVAAGSGKGAPGARDSASREFRSSRRDGVRGLSA